MKKYLHAGWIFPILILGMAFSALLNLPRELYILIFGAILAYFGFAYGAQHERERREMEELRKRIKEENKSEERK